MKLPVFLRTLVALAAAGATLPAATIAAPSLPALLAGVAASSAMVVVGAPQVDDPPTPAPPAISPVDPPDDPDPEGELRGRFEFVTFGGTLLKDAPLIVEGEVVSVFRGGTSVSVARVTVAERMQGGGRDSEVTVLATPGELAAGQRYLLFLQPFRDGPRFTVLRRIAEGDRDYPAKRRVLRQFAKLNTIADGRRRATAIRDALIANLGDEELFVRWNALAELEAFLGVHRGLFGREERAALVEVYRGAPSPTFRGKVGDVLKDLGIDLGGSAGGGSERSEAREAAARPARNRVARTRVARYVLERTGLERSGLERSGVGREAARGARPSSAMAEGA